MNNNNKFRLTILHAAGSVDWNLQISDVNPQDSGEYECQVLCVDFPDIQPYLDGPDIRPVIIPTRYRLSELEPPDF